MSQFFQARCSNDSTWVLNTTTLGFCNDGSNECRSPKFPKCQDRTILCLEDLPNLNGLVKTDLTTNVTINSFAYGANHSYSCSEDGYVIDYPGYPEMIYVECTYPQDYNTQWYYGIWEHGIWTNIDNISKCIDPMRCYSDIPALPSDLTVRNDQREGFQVNEVGAVVHYMCDRPCKVFLIICNVKESQFCNNSLL